MGLIARMIQERRRRTAAPAKKDPNPTRRKKEQTEYEDVEVPTDTWSEEKISRAEALAADMDDVAREIARLHAELEIAAGRQSAAEAEFTTLADLAEDNKHYVVKLRTRLLKVTTMIKAGSPSYKKAFEFAYDRAEVAFRATISAHFKRLEDAVTKARKVVYNENVSLDREGAAKAAGMFDWIADAWDQVKGMAASLLTSIKESLVGMLSGMRDAEDAMSELETVVADEGASDEAVAATAAALGSEVGIKYDPAVPGVRKALEAMAGLGQTDADQAVRRSLARTATAAQAAVTVPAKKVAGMEAASLAAAAAERTGLSPDMCAAVLWAVASNDVDAKGVPSLRAIREIRGAIKGNARCKCAPRTAAPVPYVTAVDSRTLDVSGERVAGPGARGKAIHILVTKAGLKRLAATAMVDRALRSAASPGLAFESATTATVGGVRVTAETPEELVETLHSAMTSAGITPRRAMREIDAAAAALHD